jgi:hypothetical protein
MTDVTVAEDSEADSLATLQWILRIGVAGCFIGHGAFGIITKAGWLPYFAVGGIDRATAWRLMPLIGSMDIVIGISVLFYPLRPVLVWAVVWATWTALCRPLAGESMWEFVERAGNYGVPLALLVATAASSRSRLALDWILRGTTVAVLLGHAGCTLTEPGASFTHNCAVLWPDASPRGIVGFALVEIGLAVAVLLRPSVKLLFVVAAWKIATESLFLLAHAPVWEVVERFGSYTAPLALAYRLFTLRRLESPRVGLASGT